VVLCASERGTLQNEKESEKGECMYVGESRTLKN
jgi:hypothetical protein